MTQEELNLLDLDWTLDEYYAGLAKAQEELIEKLYSMTDEELQEILGTGYFEQEDMSADECIHSVLDISTGDIYYYEADRI